MSKVPSCATALGRALSPLSAVHPACCAALIKSPTRATENYPGLQPWETVTGNSDANCDTVRSTKLLCGIPSETLSIPVLAPSLPQPATCNIQPAASKSLTLTLHLNPLTIKHVTGSPRFVTPCVTPYVPHNQPCNGCYTLNADMPISIPAAPKPRSAGFQTCCIADVSVGRG